MNRRQTTRFMALVPLAALSILITTSQAQAKLCIHIDSYHKGYAWSDEIREGLHKTLEGSCKVEDYYMDTKRHPGNRIYSIQKGNEMAKIIEKEKPDVVIVSDDNATNDVLKAHFKNSSIPFVFCGVNWTADQYGLPFKNTTGMLEVVPIAPMLKEIKKALPHLKKISFVSSDNETERKEYDHIKKVFNKQGIEVQSYWARTFDAWKIAFRLAQDNDLIYFNNFAGINDWNKDAAIKFISENMKKLSVAPQDFMAPYTAFAVTKTGVEQGEWAAKAAIKILKGAKPSSIPIARNKRYLLLINPPLLKKANVKLDPKFLAKAKKI